MDESRFQRALKAKRLNTSSDLLVFRHTQGVVIYDWKEPFEASGHL